MRKRIIAIACMAALLGTSAYGKGKTYRSIQLTAKDATTMLVNMSEDMSLTFETDSLLISTTDYTVKFGLDNLAGWTFSTEWSSVGLKPEPVYEAAGNGTADEPYNVPALMESAETKTTAWLTGYIVGSFTGTSIETGANFTSKNHVSGNILIAPAADVTNPAKCVAVQFLSSNKLRPEINLLNNPENLGKEIAIKGTVDEFGGRTGMKNPTLYEWGNVGKEPVAIDGITAEKEGFNINGSTVTFKNLPDNSRIALYTAGGQLVSDMTADNATTLSLDGLQTGVYLLSINGKTAKITVKR